tara:strand:+ start:1635 stop:2447 length:813 start_codon:yes stop_codon:yes gene_type:complete
MPSREKGDSMGRIITVGGPKGGAGKSTTHFHMSVEFMRRGYDVATLDLDTKLNTYFLFQRRYEMDHYLRHGSMPEAPLEGFGEVLLTNEDIEILPAATKKKIQSGIPLPVKSSYMSGDLDTLSSVVEDLRSNSEILIIDTGGGDVRFNRRAISYSDMFVVPVLPSVLDMDTLADAASLVGDVKANNKDLIVKSLINQKPTHSNDFRAMALKRIIKEFPSLSDAFKTSLDFYYAYRDSLSYGLGVCEWTHSKAGAQISNVVEEIITEFTND